MKDVGNEAEDLQFYGGRFGIVTEKPSPGWQFTLLDSSFEGQREAAIEEHEAGLTLVRDSFRNVPTAVSIDPGYAEELWMQGVRMENISGPAIVISNERNERTEIHAQDLVCHEVPMLAHFRESGKDVAGRVGELCGAGVFAWVDGGAGWEARRLRLDLQSERVEQLPSATACR